MTMTKPVVSHRLLCITNLVSLLVTTLVVVVAWSSQTAGSTTTSDYRGTARRALQTDECCSCTLSLVATEPETTVTAESLRCIYRETFGARESLSLQLLYIDPASPSNIAFALYFTNPVPATPFDVSAGSQGEFDFEVFPPTGGHYFSILQGGELSVQLDALPSGLQDDEVVTLSGSLVVPNEFTLPPSEFNPPGLADGLVLAAGRVAIDCQSTYQRVETFE